MWFRRTVDEGAAWVGIAHSSGVLYAARALCTSQGKPQLLALDFEAANDLGEGLQLLLRSQKLKQARLCAVMERTQYRLLSVEVPDVPQSEWRDAMRWRLKDYVDFPMDDALLDLLPIPEDTQLRQSQQAMALVTQRRDYEHWTLGADDVGLRWKALETPETSLRVLSALAETPGEAHAMLVFGQSYALLLVTYKGKLVMTRNIEIALESIVGETEKRGSALGRASLEVLRTLDSFERMHSEARLSGLSVVSPMDSEDVIEVLTDLIYVPVKKFLLKDWVDVSALGDRAERIGQMGQMEEYAAIGAALRGYAQQQGAQLLQLIDTSDLQAQRVPWSANLGVKLTSAVVGGALVAGGVMSIWSGWINRQVLQVEEQMKRTQTQTALPQAPVELQQLKELQQQEIKQRQLRDVMKMAVAQSQAPYSDYLIALARQTIPGLWITDLQIGDQGRELTLVGRMVEPGRLPNYLEQLEEEPQFQGRRFSEVELRAVSTDPGVMAQVIEFTLRGQPSSTKATSRQANNDGESS